MERQLYVNCLKIVFRLLDMISSSLSVSVCGHTFRLTIEKQEDFMATLAETAAQQRTMATPVDTQLLMDLYVDDPKMLVLATMTEKLNLMILFRSIFLAPRNKRGSTWTPRTSNAGGFNASWNPIRARPLWHNCTPVYTASCWESWMICWNRRNSNYCRIR